MRIRVLPYKQGSKSAKALATALGGKVLKLEGSTWVAKPGDLVINWGNTHTAFAYDCDVLNGYGLDLASNKWKFFQLMQGEHSDIIPAFWINPEDIPEEAFPVVCRTILNGHSGAGIHLASSRADLVVAPLYTKYIKKEEEYRVHVGRRSGDTTTPDERDFVTIAIQRKARRLEHENPNWQIRNHANGFVFVREGFTAPEAVVQAAHRALQAVSLDFGAVDVIWNANSEKAYVLEINTAPGLEGQTVEDYANFFRGLA